MDLRKETQFLARYDRIVKAVDERFDVRGSDLATLVVSSLDNGGKVSKRRRKQFEQRPSDVMDALKSGTQKANAVAEETVAVAKKAMRQDYFPRTLSMK